MTGVRPLDKSKTYLITGVAGFIGFHLANRLLCEGCTVIGLDNLNDYYDVRLKQARLAVLKDQPRFRFALADISDRQTIEELFAENDIDIVVNLAAQAGVRYSLSNPHAYVDSNIVGFLNILEGSRKTQVEHVVYASSSSVYGANKKIPFSTKDHVNHPISLYAATKKSNELMAHAYSHLYNLPTTGLRFFTVYGPWGRPDMALFLFTRAILNDEPIQVFNHGEMQRDFTYIEDVIESMIRVIPNPPLQGEGSNYPCRDPGYSGAPYRVYNVGTNQPVKLARCIEVLEDCLGKKAKKEFLPLQPGDVPVTCADVDELVESIGFRPQTSFDEGVREFVDWYRSFYGIASP
jgi:UDP-glucuronate 4-epimerase